MYQIQYIKIYNKYSIKKYIKYKSLLSLLDAS